VVRACREVVKNFTVSTRGLAMDILRLLCEGMGLRPDYFEGDISGGRVGLDINSYPPCPDPSKTLGLPPHCDRDLITILLPGAVPGLEVAYRGDWIKVQPVPDSFVVNFGLQLEVVTNGVLKSVEHRAATNSAVHRMSVATFIVPADDCVIGPAEEFVSEDSPACYRTLRFSDFKRAHNLVNLGSSLNLTTNLKNAQN
jgi:2'-deoxymugineic-acid 2'-dioxygenase/mugineic-acid 3-dioxygenase